MVTLKIKKLRPDAIVPKYTREGDAALDFYSTEDYELQPGERHIFLTGIVLEIPQGYVLVYKDRSGLAANNGIHILGGVIDSNYRGDNKIILLNTGKEPYKILKGDRIMQALILPVPKVDIEEIEELTQTNRGDGHFGSSGR